MFYSYIEIREVESKSKKKNKNLSKGLMLIGAVYVFENNSFTIKKWQTINEISFYQQVNFSEIDKIITENQSLTKVQ